MYEATLDDKPLIVDILARAFDDNKSVNFVARQDGRRRERIRRLMDYSFEVCKAFGQIWITKDRSACALLLFPEQKRTTLQTILWDLKLLFLVVGLDRVYAVLNRERLVKANHPADKKFVYLWFLAVDPEQQGNGHGTMLMKKVLEKCADIDRPIYLETSMQRNLPFYTSLGFEVFQTVQLSYKLFQLRKQF